MTVNLDTLREVAEAATPGPWESRQSDDMPGKYVVGRRYKFGDVSKGPMTLMQPIFWDQGSADNADHIATFDPPTILALLSRLEQAEQAVERVREVVANLEDHSRPRTAHKFAVAENLRRALDGDTRG